MRKQIIYSAVIIAVSSVAAHAHEPIGLRLIREQHEQQARIQADATRQRKQFEEWEKEWQRQEQKRLDELIHKSGR
ncbi:MAG: hypothetical protein M3362_19970 [Acidobacteriota bacterium]|nr:hypothetical protein [Acidobacteriota bacterium]